ncbi:hypothetical protein [Methylobacterium sp. SD21]|uniref:hypothetical protein n=1 Tax=Methylobacterium litchii TaxID=3138810 RepID=UPI00313C4B28
MPAYDRRCPAVLFDDLVSRADPGLDGVRLGRLRLGQNGRQAPGMRAHPRPDLTEGLQAGRGDVGQERGAGGRIIE